ncbi:class I SAM-dependent methyltransferase [Aquimarina aquimarini]|uniref:class I SAM-dependent methyltransferase n=1 Tax=Aquimarina aquimarini TaxID=1191734 RepID=UPI000D54D515|nr:class I SAM-dependent methyltransferase [Aquimarina aquimarini]
MNEIYEPKFVKKLFDKMSSSYSKVNYITSFGFSERWRKQCVDEIDIEKGKIVVDLMTGMGECWKHILRKNDEKSTLISLDFSSEMTKRARKNKKRFNSFDIKILEENVFNNSIKSQTVDYIISGFGLKTFNDNQLRRLANEIDRILKPGGKFSLIEISVPKNRLLKLFFMFYLKNIIPILGKIFLGSPDTYKMLGVYTQEFTNARNIYQIFKTKEFNIEYTEYFYGCATGIKGQKTS